MAEAGAEMEAAGEMAAAGGDMAAMMEAMTPAMTMSFLLPGVGLGLLKGLLFGEDLFWIPIFFKINHFSRVVQRQTEEELRSLLWLSTTPAATVSSA